MSSSSIKSEQPPANSGSSNTGGLSSRAIAPDERQEEVVDLLHKVMAGSEEHWETLDLWQWKHTNNPFGQSLVLIAEAEDGRIAGLRTFMRWRFRSSEKILNAHRPVDTATHPDFRRRGIFSKLTIEALEHSRQSGTDIIFNTPNSMSVSGYIKMGWSQVGVATPALKVRSYPRFALRMASGFARRGLRISTPPQPRSVIVPDAFQPGTVITDDFTDLIAQHSVHENHRLRTDSSVAYLKWRYAENPLYDYAVIAERQAGTLTSACIVRMAPTANVKTLVFEEFLLSEPRTQDVRRLVDASFEAFKPDLGSAYAAPGTVMQSLLSQEGFGRQSRSRINFVCNPFKQDLSPAPYELSNWAIGISELEIF